MRESVAIPCITLTVLFATGVIVSYFVNQFVEQLPRVVREEPRPAREPPDYSPPHAEHYEVAPENHAVYAGTPEVVFKCTSHKLTSQDLYWLFAPAGGGIADIVAFGCEALVPGYEVLISGRACDLVVKNPSILQAGSYSCGSFGIPSVTGQLIVIDYYPTCYFNWTKVSNQDERSAMLGDFVLISSNIDYIGNPYFIPIMTWTSTATIRVKVEDQTGPTFRLSTNSAELINLPTTINCTTYFEAAGPLPPGQQKLPPDYMYVCGFTFNRIGPSVIPAGNTSSSGGGETIPSHDTTGEASVGNDENNASNNHPNESGNKVSGGDESSNKGNGGESGNKGGSGDESSNKGSSGDTDEGGDIAY